MKIDLLVSSLSTKGIASNPRQGDDNGAYTVTRANQAIAMALLLTLSACGGDAENAGSEGGLGEEVFGGIGQASGDVDPGDGGSASATEIGAPTQTADPSTGWVEVEGQRYEFEAIGSTHFRCDIMEDQISINFQQTTSENELSVQGSVANGQWNANVTFAPSEERQISYGASIGFDTGTAGFGDTAFSYEGTMSRVEDFDIVNAQDVQATIAVNCATPGGEPTAEVAGESLTFPFTGAGDLECFVSDEESYVLISQSQPERIQLQVDIQEAFGAFNITSGENRYGSFVPEDGTGLSIDGSSLTYEGTFTGPTGEEYDGSVSVNCG